MIPFYPSFSSDRIIDSLMRMHYIHPRSRLRFPSKTLIIDCPDLSRSSCISVSVSPLSHLLIAASDFLHRHTALYYSQVSKSRLGHTPASCIPFTQALVPSPFSPAPLLSWPSKLHFREFIMVPCTYLPLPIGHWRKLNYLKIGGTMR